jgi:hypothetical protein
MAIANFIPEVWAARILSNLNKALVYGNIVNTDYEGDISQFGDQVHINSIGRVTIGSYTKDTDISDPEALTDTQQTLTINQAKYFNFQIDDIDKAQTQPKLMDEAMREAAYGLANVTDTYIAGLYTAIGAGNSIGDDTTPIVPTASTAYDKLIDLGVILDENNTPETDRFVVVPPWYYGLLLKDDRFVKYNPGADEVKRTGEVGEVDGMTVYKSNNVPNTSGTKYKIIAGYRGAIAFASQISEVEAYRPEKRFADAMKGLELYGAKVTRAANLALLTASKS